MKHSNTAALISTLLFPGSGHLWLKHYALGILFAGTASACLCVLLWRAIEVAQAISEQILTGDIPLDPFSISAEISSQSAAAGSTLTTVATWLLVACWIIASADAFRLGRRLDHSENSQVQAD